MVFSTRAKLSSTSPRDIDPTSGALALIAAMSRRGLDAAILTLDRRALHGDCRTITGETKKAIALTRACSAHPTIPYQFVGGHHAQVRLLWQGKRGRNAG